MSDQPEQYTRVYGFAPRRQHFIWRPPEEVEPPVDPPQESENASLSEVLDAVRELGTTAPSVTTEMLRILTEPEPQAQQPQLPSPAETNNNPADLVGRTTDVTAASAVIEVTSPPANSGRKPSGNSRARKKARSCSKTSRARSKTAKALPPEPPQKLKRLSRLELHQAHCGICGDELQEEIDERFVNWDYVSQIAHDYNLNRSALYRHAAATGLFTRRDRNLRRALGHIIHEAGRVTVTADAVVRAVKVFAHINARGDWVNPPTHVIFSSAVASRANAAQPRAPKLSGTPSHLKRGPKR